MLIKKVGNFVKGNIAGAAVATKSVLILRPILKGSEVAIVEMVPRTTNIKQLARLAQLFGQNIDLRNSLPKYINSVYKKNGAPKSGEFWTQSVSSFVRKITKKN